MKLIKLTAIAFAFVCAMPVFAQNTNTPKIDKHQTVQQKRIAQGMENGSLTPKEAANLEKREAGIAKQEAVAKSDGKVTKHERKQLLARERHVSKKIHAKKHNKKTA
jgi:hypothetical protein